MKRINWHALSWTIPLVIFWLFIVWLLTGCAKPNYEMIERMHESTMIAHAETALALASIDPKDFQVRIHFEEEVLLPAGTKIEVDKWYNVADAFEFPDSANNPGTEAFKAEAARDGQVFTETVRSAVKIALGYFALEAFDRIAKNVGETRFIADNQSTLNFSGGYGDKTSVTGGMTTNEWLDLSDRTADPFLVDPVVVQP